MLPWCMLFFFNDTATTEIYTLSLHDALPISAGAPPEVVAVIAAANEIVGKPDKYGGGHGDWGDSGYDCSGAESYALNGAGRSEEHTSELQSRQYLVCRPLLEKKNVPIVDRIL